MKLFTYLVNNSFRDSKCLCYSNICYSMIPKSCTLCCPDMGPEDWKLWIKMLRILGPSQCSFPVAHWHNVPFRSHPTLSYFLWLSWFYVEDICRLLKSCISPLTLHFSLYHLQFPAQLSSQLSNSDLFLWHLIKGSM